MEQKNSFYNSKIKELLNEGLIREIYSSSKISIMNISNSCYAVFDYEGCFKLNSIFGLIMDAQSIRTIINDESQFRKWLNGVSKKEVSKCMLIVNDANINVMKSLKSKTDVSGPTEDIDLQLEQELMQKNKSR